MNSSERASHPSRTQVEFLVEFLEKNPNIAKGFPKVPSARDAARKTWEALAVKLNYLGGCEKSWRQWTKYWADKKSAVKKKAALRSKARNKTDGGRHTVVELSQVEEKILSVMGGQTFSVGDRHLDIKPKVPSPLRDTDSLSCRDNSSLLAESSDIPLAISPHMEAYTGTSHPSERPSVINHSPRKVSQAPAGTPSTSPSQPATPSGSGTYPARRRLNLSCSDPPHNTTSTGRLLQRRIMQSPSSQRQSQFVDLTERFLVLEEQRIEIDRRNSRAMEVFLDSQLERDRASTAALNAIADGLKLLADVLKK